MESLARLERIYDEDYDLGDSNDDEPHVVTSDSEPDDEIQLDDFEREMQAELSRKIEQRGESGVASNTSTQPQESQSDILPTTSGTRKDTKRPTKSDNGDNIIYEEDPLYDPFLDEEDELWVNERRRRNLQAHLPPPRPGQGQNGSTATLEPLPQSDAVLNCPACMTLVCRDCQRHDVYMNQYRAMFVENCQVDESTCLDCPLKDSDSLRVLSARSRKRRRGAPIIEENTEEADAVGTEDHQRKSGTASKTDKFHPVLCETCNTQVAVMGIEDEVYHFYNVVASHS